MSGKAMHERDIVVRGTAIHVRESDGGAGYPPLLCIHGNLGSGRWFEPFAADYPGRVIAPDMPNFGASAHIGEWSIEAYGRWIGAICDELGITRAVVLGHSLGGAVAMELLATRPALVERLILVDSSPVEGLFTPPEYYPAIEAYKADKSVLAQALRTVVPYVSDEEFFGLLVDDAWKMNRDCFIGHAETLGTADYRTRLRDVSVPVHVLYGAHDVLITDERAKATADFFGAAVHRFETSGHSPMVETPAEFTGVVDAIVRGAA